MPQFYRRDTPALLKAMHIHLIGLVITLQLLRATGKRLESSEMQEHVLAVKRRVLGEDHPATLSAASSLAMTLRELAEYEKAYRIDEDTLERRMRVLGDNHPDTRRSIRYLASDREALYGESNSSMGTDAAVRDGEGN